MSMDNLMNGSQVGLWDHNLAQEPNELVKDEIQSDREDDILQNIKQLERLEVGDCNIHVICQLEGFPITRKQSPLVISLNYMKIENLPELRFLCNGPRKSLNLKHLTWLSIENCSNLTFIFSSSILRSLPLLKSLTIIQCKQLQQIIEEDEKDQNSSNFYSQQVCFPSLTTIDIQECNNLKFFFIILSSHELPQLEELIIEECSLLENVFAFKDSNTEGEQAIMFTKLTKLRLRKLPNLVNVYKGFKWQSVDDKQVDDCPKLTPSMDGTSMSDNRTDDETSSMDGTSMSVNGTDDGSSVNSTDHESPSMDENSTSNDETPSMDGSNDDAIQLEKKEAQSPAALTDPKDDKDIDMKLSTSQDVHMTASLAQTNQEYLTSAKKGGSIKKMKDKNDTEKSTTNFPKSTKTRKTPAETSLPENIKSKKITDIDKGRGDLQTQEFNTSINQFNTEESLQEQNTTLREEMVKKTSKSDQVSADHHQEGFEADKVHLGDPTSGLDLNKEANTKQKMPQVNSQNKEEELVGDSILMEQRKTPDEMKAQKELQLTDSTSQVAPISASSKSLGESSVDLPTPLGEYATFRDIGAMKKKHIPLLEKAFAKYPSLWDWPKKFKRPQIKAIKQLVYTILGDMLEFLESTRWRDLTDEKKAEFESFVNDLEAFGFEIKWLGNTCDKIKQSELDERSIKQKRALEEQVAAEQHRVEEMKVHLQMAEAKLQKCKLELDAIEAKLGHYNNFIGF